MDIFKRIFETDEEKEKRLRKELQFAENYLQKRYCPTDVREILKTEIKRRKHKLRKICQ